MPITRFGRPVDSVALRSRHRIFNARPPSIAASLEPTVDVPTAGSAVPAVGPFQRADTISRQRRSISAVCGYSSRSTMFLSNVSAISRAACGSIHVVTKVARFIRELPSSISSSWISSYAVSALISPAGIRSLGTSTRGRRA